MSWIALRLVDQHFTVLTRAGNNVVCCLDSLLTRVNCFCVLTKSGEASQKKKSFNLFYLLHSLIRMWNLWLMRTPSCQCLVSCKTHCKVHTFAQPPSPVRIGQSCYQATIEDHCSDKKRPGQHTDLSIYRAYLRNLLYFLIKNSFLFEKHYSVHSITLHSDNYNGHFMTILQWIKPWLLRLASAATVHWWTKLGRNSRYFFYPCHRYPNPTSSSLHCLLISVIIFVLIIL